MTRLSDQFLTWIDAALEAFYQPMDDTQGNAIGRLRGSGGGAELMLYAPLDTAFAGTDGEDHPWLGVTTRGDGGRLPLAHKS